MFEGRLSNSSSPEADRCYGNYLISRLLIGGKFWPFVKFMFVNEELEFWIYVRVRPFCAAVFRRRSGSQPLSENTDKQLNCCVAAFQGTLVVVFIQFTTLFQSL